MDEFTNTLLSGSEDPSSAVNNILNGTTDTSAQIGAGIPDTGFLGGFTIETIIIGIMASIIGAYYLKIGKKDGKIITVLCGIVLLGITYFIKDMWYLIGVSLVVFIIPIIKRD